MIKVSIIIPVYNVEKYLRECLDSVVNQTLKDIEIICINDGSTDNSLKILEEFSSKDNRVKIINKQNSGYGASMNIGLENASGEYIGIVESDDFAELNMFETLYNLAKEHDLDLARGQYYFYNSKDNTNILCDNSWVVTNKVYNPLDDDQTPFWQAPSIWANIFKNSMIKQNNIKFLETLGASYQDTSFAFKLYACSKKFMMIKDPFIHYRIDNENSSVNSIEKSDFVIYEYKEIIRFAQDNNIYDKVKFLIPRMKRSCYSWNYDRLNKKLKFQFLLKWSKECLNDFSEGNINIKLYSFMELGQLILVAFFPFLYRFARFLICH